MVKPKIQKSLKVKKEDLLFGKLIKKAIKQGETNPNSIKAILSKQKTSN